MTSGDRSAAAARAAADDDTGAARSSGPGPAAGITGITPCLWFDGQAEAAAALYADVLPGCTIASVLRAPTDTPAAAAGAVLAVTLALAGRSILLLNGAGSVRFTMATSLQLECAGQAEVDRVWAALAADGGEQSRCGWLRDRFGAWWQVLPAGMTDWTAGPDPAGAARAVEALMEMDRIDLAALRAAYIGHAPAASRG